MAGRYPFAVPASGPMLGTLTGTRTCGTPSLLFLRPPGFTWRNFGTSTALWPKLLIMLKSLSMTKLSKGRRSVTLPSLVHFPESASFFASVIPSKLLEALVQGQAHL